VIPLDARIAGQLGMARDLKGLVVDVVGRAGSGGQKGLRRGFVIVSANYKPLTSSADFGAAIKKAKAANRRTLLLGVKRQRGPTQYIALEIGR